MLEHYHAILTAVLETAHAHTTRTVLVYLVQCVSKVWIQIVKFLMEKREKNEAQDTFIRNQS